MNTVSKEAKIIIRDSQLRLAILAVLVGLVSGFGAVIFRGLIALFHNLFFFGHWSFSYNTSLHTAPSPWGAWIIVVPVLGAIIVAYLVKTFAPEAKGHGMPEVIEAVHFHKGAIRPVVALIKALASSLSIGSGAAIGREGPIIQIGAAFGSTLGQVLRLSEWQRITLIAGGAGGGIAATFNTPIGGLLFATELILPEISARTMIPVAISTVCGTFIGQMFFGVHPSFHIPELTLTPTHLVSLSQFGAYIILGALLGLVCVVYIRSIYAFEDIFDRIPGGYYVRHMLGMALVGVMMYLFLRYTGHYYIQGVGYATIQDILDHSLLLPVLLIVLFIAKLLATSLSLGSGGSGGIFSPSLFMGAVLGAAYALLASRFVPGMTLAPVNTAVIGMAAMVAGATGAVITAIVMIFEMTRDYYVIVPLMAAVSVAYGVRRAFLRDSIYTMKISRRGLFLPDTLQTPIYLLRTASDALTSPMLRFNRQAGISDLKTKLQDSRVMPNLLVTNNDKVDGIVTADLLAEEESHVSNLAEIDELIQHNFIAVAGNDMLFDVVSKMRGSNADLAIVTTDGKLERADNILGILTWRDIVRVSNLPSHLVTSSKNRTQSHGKSPDDSKLN